MKKRVSLVYTSVSLSLSPLLASNMIRSGPSLSFDPISQGSHLSLAINNECRAEPHISPLQFALPLLSWVLNKRIHPFRPFSIPKAKRSIQCRTLTEEISSAPKDKPFGGSGPESAIVPGEFPDLLALPPDVVNQDTDGDEEEEEGRDYVSRVEKGDVGHALAVSLTLHSPVAEFC
jgi:hypothetical protein